MLDPDGGYGRRYQPHDLRRDEGPQVRPLEDPPGRRACDELPTMRCHAYDDHHASWDAWHIADTHQGHEHGEFAVLDEAIAWVRERCERIRIVDPHTAQVTKSS